MYLKFNSLMYRVAKTNIETPENLRNSRKVAYVDISPFNVLLSKTIHKINFSFAFRVSNIKFASWNRCASVHFIGLCSI